jgi:hypothetical protein
MPMAPEVAATKPLLHRGEGGDAEALDGAAGAVARSPAA